MIKKIALILVAVLALAQAGYLTWAYYQEREESSENAGAEYVCLTQGCGHEFAITREDMVRLVREDTGVKCPKCTKYLVQRAARCQTCKALIQLVGHGSLPDKCPKCGSQVSIYPVGTDATLVCEPGTEPGAPGSVEVAKNQKR
jgi:DNA-directed RNA polymerase subunit RPC12/RpoP